MSTDAALIRTRSLGDRYSEWAVIAVTAIALLAGALIRASVEGQTRQLSADGVSAEVPVRWIAAASTDGGALLQARATSGVFPTIYRIEAFPLADDATLDDAFVARTLQLGSELTAFNVLESAGASVNGRPAIKVSFAYVVSDPNVQRENVPTSVRGDEYIFLDGHGRALAVQFAAESDNYERALPGFERFLLSVSF